MTIIPCHFCKITEGDRDDDEEPFLVVESERNSIIGGYHVRCRKCWSCGPNAPTEERAKQFWNSQHVTMWFGDKISEPIEKCRDDLNKLLKFIKVLQEAP